MGEWLKKYGLPVLLALAVLVLLMQGKLMGDLQALQRQVQRQSMDMGSVQSMIAGEIGGLQSRLEESLQREASALSDIQWELGALDVGALVVPLTVSVTPREVARDTRVRVQVSGGESIPLEKSGVTYTGTLRVGLFEEISMKVLLERGGVTTVEEPMLWGGSLWEQYRVDNALWTQYTVQIAKSKGAVSVDGVVHVELKESSESGNAVKALSLRAELDGEELWTRPMTRAPGYPPPYTEAFQDVTVGRGQTLGLTLLVMDSAGLVYHYQVPGGFQNEGQTQGQNTGDFVFTGVYNPSGTLIYTP